MPGRVCRLPLRCPIIGHPARHSQAQPAPARPSQAPAGQLAKARHPGTSSYPTKHTTLCRECDENEAPPPHTRPRQPGKARHTQAKPGTSRTQAEHKPASQAQKAKPPGPPKLDTSVYIQPLNKIEPDLETGNGEPAPTGPVVGCFRHRQRRPCQKAWNRPDLLP